MAFQTIPGFDETLIPLALDSVPVAISLVDLGGKLLYYNEYGRSILDRKPELLGKDIRHCHEKPESIARIDQMLEAFKGGRREPFVYENVRFERRIVVTLSPLLAEGRLIGCVQSVIVKP